MPRTVDSIVSTGYLWVGRMGEEHGGRQHAYTCSGRQAVALHLYDSLGYLSPPCRHCTSFINSIVSLPKSHLESLVAMTIPDLWSVSTWKPGCLSYSWKASGPLDTAVLSLYKHIALTIVRRSCPMKTTGFRRPWVLRSILTMLGHYSPGHSAFYIL